MIQKSKKFIHSDWLLTETVPNACESPSDLHALNVKPIKAIVPGTVAQAYQAADIWSINDSFDFDTKDWWYQTNFSYSPETTSPILNLQSLATLCDVWLNGKHILSSQNMFISHQLDVSEYLKQDNQLTLCFRSLKHHLAERRPRPRWKTKLVEQQQLRWIRTTLLGRIPGWTPPVAPVGPVQQIYLSEKLFPVDINIVPTIQNEEGIIDFTCKLYHQDESKLKATLTINKISKTLALAKNKNGNSLSCQLKIKNSELKRWWPHTHGKAQLFTPELTITIDNKEAKYSLPPIGFKEIQIDQSNNGFKFLVNGQPIFARGACWTINDIVSLTGNNADLKQTLTLMRDAGANMIRIGGTMIYEQDLFYELCDQLGIMVWQDFMFANMDYPIDDSNFARSVDTETRQIISRLSQHACISMYCGNSEIEQQTSMLGLSKKESNNILFTEKIPALCKEIHSDIPYIASTPTGDMLPFHTNKNVSHYYGVGAYLRPISELRQHNVKFTSESLGFANVPIARTRNQILNGQLPVMHHPKWKERVPRDTGTGWDFEDVRDHYTNSLFNIDTTKSRCFDTERYLKLSEVTTGEIMSQVFSEWRSSHSESSGGLIWFLKDFWQGAGWGIVDSTGLPKACYYYLKRCWQPINVGITNETLNGVDIHINNETSQKLKGKLEISLFNKKSVSIASHIINVTIPKFETQTINSDVLLQNFYDTTYSYRFGPTKHSIVAVQLKDDKNKLISEACFFPNTEEPYSNSSSELKAEAKKIDEDTYSLKLTCNCFLYATCIEVDGYTPSDNFFHLLPNTIKQVTLKKTNSHVKRFKGYVGAINLDDDIKIEINA